MGQSDLYTPLLKTPFSPPYEWYILPSHRLPTLNSPTNLPSGALWNVRVPWHLFQIPDQPVHLGNDELEDVLWVEVDSASVTARPMMHSRGLPMQRCVIALLSGP